MPSEREHGPKTGVGAEMDRQERRLTRQPGGYEGSTPLGPRDRWAGPIPGAGHNPPKPHHGKERVKEKSAKAGHKHELVHRANHALPTHMRGRGMISSKAMAIMGKQLASAATPAVGKRVAKAGKSRSAKPDAKQAKPWKGQKLPGRATPDHGKQDAERGGAVEEHTNT